MKCLTEAASGAAPNYLADGTSLAPDQSPAQKMFKIATYPIIAGSILCALQAATGPPASALDQWVQLTNHTRMAIVEIYISHVGAQLWDIDLLGTDFLAPVSSVWTSIDDAAGCRFDIKIVFDDGTTQIRRNVNVCGLEKLAISFR